jgi:5'-3' exonuclease
LNYIKKCVDKNTDHVINGLDGDLVMLGICSGAKRVRLFRENTLHYATNADFLTFSIHNLKENLYTDTLEQLSIDGVKLFKSRMLSDWVFMNFVLGNDFVPNLKYLEINKNGLNHLLCIYAEKFNEIPGYLVNPKFITDGFRDSVSLPKAVNLRRLKDLFSEIYGVLKLESSDFAKWENSIEDPQTDMCRHYIKTLIWVLVYYFDGCKDFRFHYPYHYPPTVKNLEKYLEKPEYKFLFDFEHRPPVDPLTQLVCILPPESKNLLPDHLQSIFEKSSLEEYFPETFEVDYSGCKYNWQGKVLLPFIDIHTVEQELKR